MDDDNHYLSRNKRWGSRFRQRELELFFWSTWKMAKFIDFTVIPYVPFRDAAVKQSSFVTLFNEKARDILDLKKFVKPDKADAFVYRPRDEDALKYRTRISPYEPWQLIEVPCAEREISVVTVGGCGVQVFEQQDNRHTELVSGKVYKRSKYPI